MVLCTVVSFLESDHFDGMAVRSDHSEGFQKLGCVSDLKFQHLLLGAHLEQVLLKKGLRRRDGGIIVQDGWN